MRLPTKWESSVIRFFAPENKTCSTHKLSTSQRKTLFGWGDNIFSGDHLNLTWQSECDRHFLASHKRKWVAHVGLMTSIRILVGARQLTVCGIGGVVTLPHARGLGLSRRLIDESVRFSEQHTNGVHMLLFCLDHLVRFYIDQQFELATAEVTFEQPDGPVVSPLNALHRPLRDETWPDGPIQIDALPW
jgi:GNAT superfamily N-acetyltransferase